MATDQLGNVFQQLRKAALLRDGAGLTDGQLLECFVTQRDEAAFEALVRRHGPMVLGLCRRVLRHPQDAEDAFQATFLVLVRKAAAIGQRELLGNWLYGVAYRTALDARAAASRRRTREKQVSPMPEPVTSDGLDIGRDLRLLLDQELNRLPDKYRVPVVLCNLEGRTRQEVARQLGLPVGTLSGRLTTARRMLAKRLARHGLALSAGALSAALSQGEASASVPTPLVTRAVEVARAVAAGQGAATVVSAKAVALAEGVLKAMLVKMLKTATAVVLVAGIVVGAGLLKPHAEDNNTGGAKVGQRPRILKLDGRGRRVVWSPDGKTLAVVTKVEKTFLGIQYDRNGSAVKLWDVEKGEVSHTLAEDTGGGLAFQQVVFSADGKTIAATVSEEVILPNLRKIHDVVKVWDTNTFALKLTVGDDSQLVCVALSPDGKLLAAGDPSKKVVQLWNAGTGARERTLEVGQAQPWSLAFSPDSQMLIVGGQTTDHSGQVQVWDAQTWTLKHVLKQAQYVNTVAISANSKVVASGGGGEVVQLWNPLTGESIRYFQGVGSGTRSVAFSPEGRTVAAGGKDGKVRLWDVQTGALKETLEGYGAEIYSLAFSPEGKTLASVSQDQTLRLWPIQARAAGSK
jgi:RNA polymerase sigma factor (sigma-70 family)